MKLNKKLSVAIIISIMSLGAVGCGKNNSQGSSNEPDRAGEGGNPIKMSQEEIDKALENGTILRDN